MRNSSQRVIHCLRAPTGGLFRHVRDLAEGQQIAGWQVGLICDRGSGGTSTDDKLRALAPHCALGIHRLDMQRYPAFSDIRVVQRISRICKQLQPGLLHGHGAKGAAYARLAAARCRARAICTPHGGWLHFSPRSLSGMAFAGIERALKARTHGMIFESAYSANVYARRAGTLACPQAVIHNGLSEGEYAPLPACAPRYDFAFIGELRMLKGLGTLLDAVARLPDAASVKILIAGEGPDHARFRARAMQLGLGGVTFSAPIYPATSAFAGAACVVVPSLSESLPYIVLEAAACGAPMIATAAGGIPEIFGPYSDRLVKPGDAPALADAMQRLRSNPAQAHQDAQQLREYVHARFGLNSMVERTLAFYERVQSASPI
jgi:glycosyltransferase involved in cell wall biosynthesis